jgi:hypothetical protein
MRFRFEFMSLTQIGELFGVSNQQVGKWLATIGLREKGKNGLKPTREAYAGGFVKDVPSRGQGYIWAWHSEKTVKALEQAGHKLVALPGSELLMPVQLNGPFQHRPHPQFGQEIVNGDGSVCLWAQGEHNARFLCQLLNLAHSKGVVDRILGSASNVVAVTATAKVG